MKLTKLIHSTLLLEYKDLKILFDPGDYSTEQVKLLKDIDLVIITHSHSDHFDIESIKTLIKNNPKLYIVTNTNVANILLKENIESQVCDKGNETTFNGINIKSFDFDHVAIWKDIEMPQNTAYLLDDAFYNPGDSFGVIDAEPEICAFMITGPGSTVSDAMNFAINQKMKLGIGIHDGMLNRKMVNHLAPENFLKKYGKNYKNLNNGESYEV